MVNGEVVEMGKKDTVLTKLEQQNIVAKVESVGLFTYCPTAAPRSHPSLLYTLGVFSHHGRRSCSLETIAVGKAESELLLIDDRILGMCCISSFSSLGMCALVFTALSWTVWSRPHNFSCSRCCLSSVAIVRTVDFSSWTTTIQPLPSCPLPIPTSTVHYHWQWMKISLSPVPGVLHEPLDKLQLYCDVELLPVGRSK